MAKNFFDLFGSIGDMFGMGQSLDNLTNLFNTTSFTPVDTSFMVNTPLAADSALFNSDRGHGNDILNMNRDFYDAQEAKEKGDHNNDDHADNGKGRSVEVETTTTDDTYIPPIEDVPTLEVDIPVVDTPTLTAETKVDDLGSDTAREKSNGNADHGQDVADSKGKDKGDHNDDGHADNGKDDEVVEPDVDPTPDPLPTLLFTPEDDNFNFNDYVEVLPVADANDGMHDALSGDDIVFLPETQEAADAVGYDTTIAFNGGDGNDIIHGGDYDDIIRTGVDRNPDASYDYDSHSSGYGTDVVFGNGGNDIITGDRGHDELHGGDGDDVIMANGDAWLTTEGDSIYGDAGNDILRGSYGDDWLNGGTGDDYLEGQGGNDWLDGGTGSDSVHGGKGDDTFIFELGDGGGDKFYGEDGDDTLQFNFDTIDDMMGSLQVIRAASDHATSDSASTAWHNSDAGFSMVGIENVTAYVGGEAVDWESYTSVPDTSMDVVGVDPSGFDMMI